MYLHKHASANNISLDDFPFKRELAMESYIIENPSVLRLKNISSEIPDILLTEANLLNGRRDRNTDGRIDILAGYESQYLAIVELKMGKLEQKHLDQLESYLSEREQILNNNKGIWDAEVSAKPKWIGIMVGGSIDPDLMVKITKGHTFTSSNSEVIPIAALVMNRYSDKRGNIFVITDTYFQEKINNTKQQFMYNGQKYGKGRLVLAVLKDYVQKNPQITYSELERDFPKKIQGKEVFTTLELARVQMNRDRRRHFIKPDEIITLNDSTEIAVSDQWGDNFVKFLDRCMELKINVTSA
jgi:hypothetical protein